MISSRKLALALTMNVLILVTLFLPCVWTDVQFNSQLVEPLKNWSFEGRDYSIPGDGVYRCPPWESNNNGWRELRGDVNGDKIVDIFDSVMVNAAFGSTYNATDGMYWHGPPDFPGPCPYCPHDPNTDLNGDGTVNVQDKVIVNWDFGKETNPLDGSYSWYTNGGGDYVMLQWLEIDVVMALAGEKLEFSFWFYPESVAPDGSQNQARAEIYYIYDYPDIKDAHVSGSWTAPTELKWWNACVTAILPPTTNYIAVIIHGKPDFKAWVDLAQLTTPDYNLYYTYPPYENQDTYPTSGTCIDWVNAKVCAYGNKTTGQASAYSLDWSAIGSEREAYVQFNMNPAIGNSPVVYEEDDFTVGVYWIAYGHLGAGGPGVPCISSVSISLYVYKWVYIPPYWRWEPVKTYTYTISSYDHPNQNVTILASLSWWMHISPPFGSGSYSVAPKVRTGAAGTIDCWEEGFAHADFFYDPYFTLIYYIKISD